MNSLKVTYYIENNQETVKPFVHEESSSGQSYFEIQQSLAVVKSYGLSEKLNKMWENILYTIHYVNLIKDGNTYEEILALLKQQITEKENNYSKMSTIIGLLKEKDYLDSAIKQEELLAQYLLMLAYTKKESPEFYEKIKTWMLLEASSNDQENKTTHKK